jgi:hypothetical protein
VNLDLQPIIQSKEAERRRLRALPWLEKLEMLDRFARAAPLAPADAAASGQAHTSLRKNPPITSGNADVCRGFHCEASKGHSFSFDVGMIWREVDVSNFTFPIFYSDIDVLNPEFPTNSSDNPDRAPQPHPSLRAPFRRRASSRSRLALYSIPDSVRRADGVLDYGACVITI